MDTHTDRMDYRRVPATRKQGNEQIKGKRIRSGLDTAGGAKKLTGGESRKRNAAGKRILPQKKKNTAGNKTFEWKHCQISYDPSKQTYRMISDSPEKILLLKEDNVIGTLEQGECVHVERPVTLQIQGKEESLHLK